MATENYWKEKYADVHLRLTNKIAELGKENAELKEALKTLAEGLNIRQQTLQEIKAIAEKLMADNLCNNCDGIGLDANCQDTGCPYYQMDAILQKITKAEEE